MPRSQKIYIILSVLIGLALASMLYFIISGLIIYYDISRKYPEIDVWAGIRHYLLLLIPAITGVTGLVIFVTSKFRKHGLLRIYLCFCIIGFFSNIIYNSCFFIYREPGPLNWMVYYSIFIQLLFIPTAVAGLWILSKKRKLKLNYIDGGIENIAEFAPASAGKRLVNYLIDYTIMLYSLWELLQTLEQVKRMGPRTDFSSFRHSEFPYWIYLWPLFYFIFFEGIFKTTAGKSATNTVIVNERGVTPNFGQLLGRSICRYIPFDAFSYLGRSSRGWHDTLTDTYVVNSVDSDFEEDEEKMVTEFLNRETEV